MSNSPAQVIQTLLTKPTDRQHVKSLTTPDVTYVSLSENNPELKRYLPWTGTHKGPDSIVKTFEGIGRAWQTIAFEVREVIEQGGSVAMFGSFTYRGRETDKEITSLFSILAHVNEGKVAYIQFLEDTFGTSRSVSPPA